VFSVFYACFRVYRCFTVFPVPVCIPPVHTPCTPHVYTAFTASLAQRGCFTVFYYSVRYINITQCGTVTYSVRCGTVTLLSAVRHLSFYTPCGICLLHAVRHLSLSSRAASVLEKPCGICLREAVRH